MLDVQRLSRHQNKEWPGYSRLERRVNVREHAVLLKQQTKTTEIEQAQSTNLRYTRVEHGVLHVSSQQQRVVHSAES